MTDEILTRPPSTVVLALAAMAFAVVLGGALGLVSGLRQNTLVDTLAMAVALFGVSVPVFWLALLLIMLFAVHLQWLPATSGLGWKGLVLPAVSLALLSAATSPAWSARASSRSSSSSTSRPRGRRGCPAPS